MKLLNVVAKIKYTECIAGSGHYVNGEYVVEDYTITVIEFDTTNGVYGGSKGFDCAFDNADDYSIIRDYATWLFSLKGEIVTLVIEDNRPLQGATGKLSKGNYDKQYDHFQTYGF